MQKSIVVMSPEPEETRHIRSLLSAHGCMVESTSTVSELTAILGGKRFMAIILDMDTRRIDNRVVRNLTREFPSTPILGISRDLLHPELKDAITQHIYACLKKPVDPDELCYWIDSIYEDARMRNDREDRTPR